MEGKEILVPLYLKDGRAVTGLDGTKQLEDADALRLAAAYDNAGADAILIFDLSCGDQEHDAAIGLIKSIARIVDIPLYGGGSIHRMEDVKKLIYAGCRKVFLNYGKEANAELTHEVSSRFGAEKILACVKTKEELSEAQAQGALLGGVLLLGEEAVRAYEGAAGEAAEENGAAPRAEKEELPAYVCADAFSMEETVRLLKAEGAAGIAAPEFMDSDFDVMQLKHRLLAQEIPINTYESSLSWDDFKTNSDGMIPAVV